MINYTKTKSSILSIFLLFVFFFFYSCSNPTTPEVEINKSKISISVNSEPILMIWNASAELWYMEPVITLTETNGVGINVTKIELSFTAPPLRNIGRQDVGSGRVDAYANLILPLSITTTSTVQTEIVEYETVVFYVAGTDDNGNYISTEQEFDLNYVGR